MCKYMSNILTDSLSHANIYIRHCYTRTIHTEINTHIETHIHAFPRPPPHHSHRKTLPVCVSLCMYSPRPSSSQPWISVPCLLLRRATVDLYTMAFPLGFFIRSYGSWSGYPAVSSELVAVPLELGRKCQIA